ncbi:glycoside hydrolase family 61 protein [Phanerochaete carnosa HHB-10118-sp]|uniref:AA9 family lytic polysaccharide monooxygenase n=1 Tax=Phanerochaete carnosa (strain HHB-10118-sp) TaxID=650164 RepID=K5X412_PHACS|nr:glycoside hydrolase family 61 protein [Phanerochaete carnosa HHB-10118-sp]EKM57567.1 glycoside hydrolase family 61 protein [Phanerochaete carnosa HHB-10118-sp]
MRLSIAFAASLIAGAAAHATWQELWINGVDQGSSCVRLPLSNSPVTDVTSDDLACNVTPTPSNGICSVNPGDQLSVEMHQQPADRSCATQAIGGDHYGPINIYMAKVDDATTAVGSAADWFKVDEMGLPSSNPDYWATEVLNDNCGHFTFTVPEGIAPGNYLIRAEVIALHVASSVGGAQFYMSCFQVNIGGSGSAEPPTVNFPGAYVATDPGILINIYQQLNSYAIPGPSPYNLPSPAVAATAWPTTATWNTALQPSTVPTAVPGGGAAPTSVGGSSPTSAPASVPISAPTTVSHVSTGPSSAPAAPTSVAQQYAQCGGQGWAGPTVCASPFTCTVLNPYYSQCT